MGTADNIDVGVDDMTSLLDFGFEVNFLKVLICLCLIVA